MECPASSCPSTNACTDFQKDVCFAEAARFDKAQSSDPSETTETVWRAVKPPVHLGKGNPPFVTARKLEIVRAKLRGKDEGGSSQDREGHSSTKRTRFS